MVALQAQNSKYYDITYAPGHIRANFEEQAVPVVTADFNLVIKFHIIRDQNGNGGIPESDLTYVKTALDNAYNPHGIYFLYDCKARFVDNDVLSSPCEPWDVRVRREVTQDHFLNNDHTALHIYLKPWTGGLAEGLSGGVGSNWCLIAGKPFDPATGGWPSIASSTLIHQVGHCLGLHHMHRGAILNPIYDRLKINNILAYLNGGWSPTEYDCATGSCVPRSMTNLAAEHANGTNGFVSGDFVDDTPASAFDWERCGLIFGGGCSSLRPWMCVLPGMCDPKPCSQNLPQVLDNNGDDFNPMLSNYMTIARNPFRADCRTEFTPGQVVG